MSRKSKEGIMSKRLFARFAGVFFLVFSLLCTSAMAVPPRIGYIGLWDDSSGQPLNGIMPVKFIIYDKSTDGGNVLWEETLTDVEVKHGICKVQLGSKTPLSQAIFSNNMELYLEVRTQAIQGDWNILESRNLITSSPFAIEAAHAEKAAGVDNGVVDQLRDRIVALESRVYNLQVLLRDVQALLENVTRDDTNLYFTGINVHIRNGKGHTMTANGLGNLIVGYNEESDTGSQRSGSHNIVVGDRHNYTSYGGFVAGRQNTISDSFASVSGGYGNTASGDFSSVSGGEYNTASGAGASVSGGENNEALALASSITGGKHNRASGYYSLVAGGGHNEAGLGNDAQSRFAAILGGEGNIAGNKSSDNFDLAEHATIIGGKGNLSKGAFATVSGGTANNAIGKYSSISGGRENIADGECASVSGGTANNATGKYSSISGGFRNSAETLVSSISGGNSNKTLAKGGSISGGYENTVNGMVGSVSGGMWNKANGDYSSVEGGFENTSGGDYSSINGGVKNTAASAGSSVGGGQGTTETTSYSIPLHFMPDWP